MFKFGQDIPAVELVGQTVWWICFSEVGAKICFKGGDEIRFFDLATFANSNNWQIDHCRNKLIGLAHSELRGYLQRSEAEMVLSFSNGAKFSLFDNDEDFENFEFVINGAPYIV